MQGLPFISRVISVLLTCSTLQQNVYSNLREGEREGFLAHGLWDSNPSW